MIRISFLLPPLLMLTFLAQEKKENLALQNHTPWKGSIVGTPEPPPPYRVSKAFPGVKFKNPVFMAQEPGTDRYFVAELKGKIYAFPKNNPKKQELFLDTKRDIYAFSFHPKYSTNGQVFVFSPKPGKSRVSRFVAKGKPKKGDAKSEKVIIEWTSGGHNGGEAIIGPDGYLYIATGDSTSTSDLKATGQGVDDLLAVMMRLDVDNPPPGKAYGIPKDNPFVNFPGARPEIWAFGFRNPWRMSFDEKTGDLWVGDVGQDIWEMIRLVKKGGNYGWSVQEGSHPFHQHKKAGPGPILPPIVEHHHAECRSITGGYVYYGKKFPELNGVYLYGDYEYGKVWGLRYDPKSKKKTPPRQDARNVIIHTEHVTWHKELADTTLRIASFAVSREGDIFLIDHPSGEIYQLERAPVKKIEKPFPRKLSETGLFRSVKDHRIADGLIPFSVNAPQWLDGATAERFLALPKDVKLTASNSDVNAWKADDGTVTMQTLSLGGRRIETRILVKQENHWLGYTYLWNKEQTEGTLVGALGTEVPLTVNNQRQTWHVPSRDECMFCHSRAAAFTLALSTQQLNRTHDYGGVKDNQLTALSRAGVLRLGKKKPSDRSALPHPYDAKADLMKRARGYLHVHCSICHEDSGGGNSRFFVRYHRKLDAMNLIDGEPLHGTFGLKNAKLVKPGDPYSSVLFYRISKLGLGRMPHIGSHVVDEKGLDLIHDWILSLNPKLKMAQNDYLALEKRLKSAKDRKKVITEILSSTRGALIASRLITKTDLGGMRDEIVQAGVASSNADVRDLFERFIPEEKRARRLGDFIRREEILSLKGEAKRGRELFLKGSGLQCVNCHRIQGVGGQVGPDLSQIAKENKPEEILESLIEPSRKIDEKFQTRVLYLDSGKVLTGIVTKQTKKEVFLSLLKDGKSAVLRVPTDEIDEILPQAKSLMPEGLLKNLTAQQAADLIAFLSSLK